MWNKIATATRKLFCRPRPTLSRLDALLEAAELRRQGAALQDLLEKTATYAFQMQSERDAERRVRILAQYILSGMGGTVGEDCVAVRKDLLKDLHKLICELPK